MAKDRFTDQMQAYGRWKADLILSITKYKNWLEDNEMGNPETELRIFELIDALKSDQLTIAFVAEFARGKTELINAIFFSEYDRRLLPSEAGRTTMCPTELLFDSQANQSYIRLLPIETRLEETSIQEFKKLPIHWITIELDTSSSEKLADAFKEVVRTKTVSAEEAQNLGLYDPQGDKQQGEVEIPMWRHALISFPHPLLKEGLAILDTPGLNTLGNEPELTLNMLPNAQAIIFVLAADTGVTKSDLEMWTNYVKPLGGGANRGRIVALNKVDTLWDELKDDAAIENTIKAQSNAAAKMLGIEGSNVFPVSAQKGLLAKIRHDLDLLKRSNILSLETILSQDILPLKQKIVRDNIVAEIGEMAKNSRDLLASRLADTHKQLKELKGLSGKNEDVIAHLMKKTRQEQVTYHKSVESFQANKKIFSGQQKKLMGILSLTELDNLMSKTRKNMTKTWSTSGLKAAMKDFFDIVSTTIKNASTQVDQLNTLLVTIYRKFHQDHGLAETRPKMFNITKYKRDAEALHQEAEAFRTSSMTTMTEQSFVVRKFFISLVSHARNTFFNAHQDSEVWGKAAMAPLLARIKEHKHQMEKRLESLRKINESRDTLQSRIAELEEMASTLNGQLADIDKLMETINKPLEFFIPSEKTKNVQVA